MPNGDWFKRHSAWIAGFGGAAALISFLIYGFVQQAGYNQYSQSQATNYAAHAAEEQKQACVGTPSSELTKCRAKAQAEYDLKANAGYRDYSDLIAQRKSALWAMIMGIAALIGMILSAIGVILVKRTFDETQRTNRINMRQNARATRRAIEASKETSAAIAATQRQALATSKAVTVASDANNIARDGMHRQLRAFVFSGSPIVSYNHNSVTGLVDVGDIILTVKNHGKTPAYGVKLYVKTFIHGIWNEPFESSFDQIQAVHLGDIPPEVMKERPGYYIHGIVAAHHDIIKGVSSVVVDGLIVYDDAFGKKQNTRFRYAATEKEYQRRQWSETPEGNTST